MSTSDFDYALPQELIAQTPAEPRDHSRLLVYRRCDGAVFHRRFFDLPEYLRPGDCLVRNDTRVLPARLLGRRESGGAAEALLLRRLDRDRWEALVRPGRRLPPGARLSFGDGRLVAQIESESEGGGRVLRFLYQGVFEALLDELGRMPLPPYITEELADQTRYQTVYARFDGSAAAPTAGLHFTPELLRRIEDGGVRVVDILLHVGLGTFRPVKAERIEEHRMHEEYYAVDREAADAVNRARQSGGRCVCVGTTTVRTLETVAGEDGLIRPGSGMTGIFISPGYRCKAADALITNFHLPKSTLLMLVSALMGREEALRVYRIAVEKKYRFFSFGDAMLIL